VITWTGAVQAGAPVTITFGVTLNASLTPPAVVVNTAVIDDGAGHTWQRQVGVIAGGTAIYLPRVVRK
jgi:hypothetical protein